jgi:hypothetical protein
MDKSSSVLRSVCVLTGPVVYFCLLLAVLAAPLNAQTTSSWNGGTGNWSVSSDWNPSGVPNNIGSTTFSVNVTAPNSVVSMDVLNVAIDNLTLAAPNFLTINAGNTLALVSGTSANYGTITNKGAIVLLFGPNSGLLPTLNNYGSISGTGGLNTSPDGTFNNYGTFSGNFNNFNSVTNNGLLYSSGESQNNGALANSGTLVNNGTITQFSGVITNSVGGTIVNHGTLQNDSLLFNDGTIYNAPGASIVNTDEVTGFFVNTGTIINAGGFNNADAVFQGGTIDNLSSGSLINQGINFLSVNTLNNAGTVTNFGRFAQFSAVTVTNSGTITNEGNGAQFFAGILFNSGMVRNTVGATLSASFINTGTVNNQGTLDSGPFTNFGRVKISDTGLFNVSTNYNQFAGSTVVNGTLTASNGAIVNILGGSLSGGGTVNGNVVMGGTMIAGTPHNPLTFNINGNYSQNATGIFTELISSKGNGLLNISGTAALAPGALLNIQLVGGYDPKNGTSFTIMDYGSEKGTFTITDPYFDHGKQEWVVSSYAGGDGDDVVLTAEAAHVVTPEPCTMLLVGSALLGMGGYAKRKKASRAR